MKRPGAWGREWQKQEPSLLNSSFWSVKRRLKEHLLFLNCVNLFSSSGCKFKKSVLSYLVSCMKMGSRRHRLFWKIMGNFFLYNEMIVRELIKPQLTYTHSVPSLGESSRTLVAIVWTNCISTTISTSCLQSFALIDIWDVKTNVVSSIQFSPAWIMEKLSPTLLYWKRLKWWNVGAVKCHRMMNGWWNECDNKVMIQQVR